MFDFIVVTISKNENSPSQKFPILGWFKALFRLCSERNGD